MTLHRANSAGFTPLTRQNTNLHQPAPNLHQRRSQPALTPAPPVRGAGGRGQVTLTKHFTAHTCRKCGAITITGTTYGLRVDLEPQVLTDHTEYAALLAGVPTYDLWPDRTARRRHLEEISHPERVPRHARHTCGTTYGILPRPAPPATSQADPTGPAPF
jgi:hypothetical protein